MQKKVFLTVFPLLILIATTVLAKEWKVYKNDKYGYEIKLPSGAVIQEMPNLKGIQILMPSGNKVSIYVTSGSLLQKGMDLWNFSKIYGFQNIEGFEEDPEYIEQIFTDYQIPGVKVVYWLTLPNGERKLSNTYVFFDTMPKSNIRIVLENRGVDLKIFDEIIRSFRFKP